MKFYMPTVIYQERDAVQKHAKEWCRLGERALLVTGKNSAKLNGALQDCTEALEGQGRSYVVFDAVEENPSVETVMRARTFGLSEGADFVVGIGGGSPLDAAKAIAIMMKNSGEEEDYLYQKVQTTALPVVAVPTTCGTGSEATPYAILTNTKAQSKGSIPHKVFPHYALVDAQYLAFAPEKVLKQTAMDAFAHFGESYVNTNATAYTKMLVREGLLIWEKSKDVFLGKREAQLQDYENMLQASTIAGMAISMTGTSLPHGLSYPLTVHCNWSHGMGVGYFQAGYLAQAQASEVLKPAGFTDFAQLEEYYQKTCNPPKADRAVVEAAIRSILSNEAKLKNCPFAVDEKKLLRMAKL